MGSLESLKQELLSQKNLIEKGGGYVVVAGTNPSPAEITEGIKTIAGSDLSIATATEEDVKLGKTFYAGSPELKTGTASIDPDYINHVFMVNPRTQTCEDLLYYTCPEEITEIRHYCFENNYNKIHFTFGENVKLIKEYAFYNARNFSFENLSELSQLEHIYSNAFAHCNGETIDLGNLPSSLNRMEEACFYNAVRENSNIKIPENLTGLGMSAFKMDNRTIVNNFEIASKSITSLNSELCYSLAFNCDLVVPTNILSISNYFNYNGCFKNLVFHKDMTALYSYCFGSTSNKPLSQFYLQSVVFEGETPPSISSTQVFAIQNIQNGFKIYVPDTAVETYKAVSNLSRYVDCIRPMSERE